MLQRNGDTRHQDRKPLPRLLDHFYRNGLNGRPLFPVLERVGPSLWDVLHEGTANWRLDIHLSRQIPGNKRFIVMFSKKKIVVILANYLSLCIPTTKQLDPHSK
jgi:hypothetical protein